MWQTPKSDDVLDGSAAIIACAVGLARHHGTDIEMDTLT